MKVLDGLDSMTSTAAITDTSRLFVDGTARETLAIPSDPVKRPQHYRQFDALRSLREVEAIDVIESIVSHYDDPVLAGLVWQQLKYLIRAPHKGKLAEDLSKADWYGRRAANKAAALKPKVQRD